MCHYDAFQRAVAIPQSDNVILNKVKDLIDSSASFRMTRIGDSHRAKHVCSPFGMTVFQGVIVWITQQSKKQQKTMRRT